MRISRREALKLLSYSLLGAHMLPKISFPKQTGSMLKRVIPSSGEQLPIVGLGTWLQFDVGASQKERDPLMEVLKLMLEKGGKLIDSSPMYGEAEAVAGDLTQASGKADQFFYATKVWTSGEQNGIKQMQSSMEKMKRKSMDLFQVHNLVDWQTHIKTLNKWKDEGKVRYTGITHYTESAHEQLEAIIRKEKIDFVQFNYSIRVRNAERSLLNAARDKGVAVIINEPFEKGSLFKSVNGKKLPEWTSDYDINSWAQFFLKYIISHPAVNCVIPGTSNPTHAVDNMTAGYGKLPDEKGRKKMIDFINSL